MNDDSLGIEALIDAVIDGRCSDGDLRRFESLVRDDPRAREAYLEQMRMHALLEWRHGRVELPIERARPKRASWRDLADRRFGLAAILLIGLGLIVLASRASHRADARPVVATLTDGRNVVWTDPRQAIAAGARVEPRTIEIQSGTIRLAFDSGAVVTVEGPADLRIDSSMRLRAVRGRITARMASNVKGFTIETPNTVVVDQGTEFGVDVDASGQTDVVVFEGLVDLARGTSLDKPTPVRRLSQGEALHVDQAGGFSRIVAVERRPGRDEWSTGPSSDKDAVIRSVSDNIRGLESSKYYQIVHRGFDEDVRAYVDRPHEWNGRTSSGLPKFLIGADYIMPFNDDKLTSDLEIEVRVARAATFYVFLDRREHTLPPWLTSRFTNTGETIGLDEGPWPKTNRAAYGVGPGQSINQVLWVWKCELEPNESIQLGSLQGGNNNRAMYGIAAVTRP